ncbi:MAG: ComF family protein [Saprospirales bacterium]|nr:ComF family protein [Saprospirales bacterium]MBK8923543.1 ComF family protein [Saprospirales bacterium]
MPTLELPNWKDLVRGLVHLIYPSLCVGCAADLPSPHTCFCIRCQRRLQPTDMHWQMENAFTDRFWGRLPLESGAAMYYFNQKSPVQKALHQLKYRNQADIGVRIGRRYGALLAQSPLFQRVEVILPVPLHPLKERLRGYNQSAMLAAGLAESLNVPVLQGVLVRNQHSASQTRQKRMDRFGNVNEVFALRRAQRIQGKHVLLVDDVLTTGATLEACGKVLLEAYGVRLSMATIAIAIHSSMPAP